MDMNPKFKFNDRVKFVDMPFYAGVIGTVVAHDSHHYYYTVALGGGLYKEVTEAHLKLTPDLPRVKANKKKVRK